MKRVAVLGLMAASLVMGRGLVADDEGNRTWTFELDEPGAIASGFKGEVGQWEVVSTLDGRVLAQKAESGDSTFNVALVADSSAKDLDLFVRLLPVAGKNDQGGGLIWRAKDSKNYYLARYNPLEDNYRVYKVVDGKRTMLQDAKAPKAEGWRPIRVVMKGDHIRCNLDGATLLDVHDSTFTQAGQVGLWSKADARSYFDDLALRPLDTSAAK